MKKMLLGAFLGMFALAGVSVLPNAVLAAGEDWGNWGDGGNGQAWRQMMEENTADFSTDYAWWGKQDTQYNAWVAGSSKMAGDSLIKTIRTAINWVLWMLSLVALVLCLWGGFQMMTSGGDSKKYESGLNVLKWAAIGLAIIALSWLIVSLIFYVINNSIWKTEMGAAQK